MEPRTDRAGIVFPPPLIVLLAFGAAIALHYLWPAPIAAKSLSIMLGASLSVFGVGIAGWGRAQLAKAGTNVNPYKPTTAIVSGGPYRFTRNPLYVGMLSLLLGLTFLMGTWWGLVLFAPAFLVLHYGVVLREEAYLERNFGHAYLSYRRKVRRWL